MAKKLAKTAVVHYEPKKEYDGLVIKFEEEEEKDTETVWKSSYKFLFEEL